MFYWYLPCSWAVFRKCAIGFKLAGQGGKLAIIKYNTRTDRTQTKLKEDQQ